PRVLGDFRALPADLRGLPTRLQRTRRAGLTSDGPAHSAQRVDAWNVHLAGRLEYHCVIPDGRCGGCRGTRSPVTSRRVWMPSTVKHERVAAVAGDHCRPYLRAKVAAVSDSDVATVSGAGQQKSIAKLKTAALAAVEASLIFILIIELAGLVNKVQTYGMTVLGSDMQYYLDV